MVRSVFTGYHFSNCRDRCEAQRHQHATEPSECVVGFDETRYLSQKLRHRSQRVSRRVVGQGEERYSPRRLDPGSHLVTGDFADASKTRSTGLNRGRARTRCRHHAGLKGSKGIQPNERASKTTSNNWQISELGHSTFGLLEKPSDRWLLLNWGRCNGPCSGDYYQRAKREFVRELVDQLELLIPSSPPLMDRNQFLNGTFIWFLRRPFIRLSNRNRLQWRFTAQRDHFHSPNSQLFAWYASFAARTSGLNTIQPENGLFTCEHIIDSRLHGVPEIEKARGVEHFCQSDYIPHMKIEDLFNTRKQAA